jgi:hypothetical protein
MAKLLRKVVAADISIEGMKVDLIDKLEREQARYKELKERCTALETTLSIRKDSKYNKHV